MCLHEACLRFLLPTILKWIAWRHSRNRRWRQHHTFWSQSPRQQVTLGLSVLVFKGATWEKKSNWETSPTFPRPHGRWVDCKLDPTCMQVFQWTSLKQQQLRRNATILVFHSVSIHQKWMQKMTHQLRCGPRFQSGQSSKSWGCPPMDVPSGRHVKRLKSWI